ncbi:hypothetical protein EKO27_g3335 [Xylaria grammica]|uniref:Xylanolytic transcriptional activator regulatory domain-containing protein n=1 Tax=Xylaria grammica TaxID=363999 RepID=A0A439DBH5_9PEZI|nr:hypothetical protein EKO27_g3335 [Xylaria grammica]
MAICRRTSPNSNQLKHTILASRLEKAEYGRYGCCKQPSHSRPPASGSPYTRSTSSRLEEKLRSVPTMPPEKTKGTCDGRLPICTPCHEAEATCVPSDRLMIRVDPNCECEALRSRAQALQNQVDHLQALLGAPPTRNNSSLHLPRGSNTRDIDSAPDGDVTGTYHDRILWPTFPPTSSARVSSNSFLSSPWHLWNGIAAVETPESEGDSGEPVSDEYASRLVDTFFLRRWPQLPFLHRKSFLESHYLPYSKNETTSVLSAFQVNMVLAIAALEKPIPASQNCPPHHTFFQKAIKNLNSVLGSNDLDCIQSLLLLYMYGSSEPQSVNLWYTAGLALRLAIGINLHRGEAIVSKDALDAEMLKRIFWSVYAMDRSLSISMGRPLGIPDGDITMPFPLCIADDMLTRENNLPVLDNRLPQANDTSTFLHVLNLRKLNADIYRTLHSAGDTHGYDAGVDTIRQQLHTRLDQWLVASPRYMATTSMNQTPEWFQIAYHQALIHLYRPSSVSPLINLDMIRICADSSISLISSYASLYAKNKITYTFVALNSAFLAAVTMLYCLRASSTLRLELTKDVAEYNVQTSMKVIKDIANGRTVGERCTRIIRQLADVTLPSFGSDPEVNIDVDTEFLSWFGLQGQQSLGPIQPTPSMASIDLPWHDLLEHGFNLDGAICPDLFL